MPKVQKRDCFISHASEDKKSFVEPLVKVLDKFNVSVWYDDYELTIGDSLSKKIDEGLVNAKFGIVVLSKTFFSKPWPEYELRSLIAREVGFTKVILPIWYKISKKQVLKFSPFLADKYAINTSGDDIQEVALKLLKVINPEKYNNVHRVVALKQFLEDQKGKSEIRRVPLKSIEPVESSPIRHESLHPSLIIRIRNIRYILQEVFPQEFSEMTLNFMRDMHPENEIRIWEGIAVAFACYKELYAPSLEEQEEVYRLLLHSSISNIEETFEDDSYKILDKQKKMQIYTIWANIGKYVNIVRD